MTARVPIQFQPGDRPEVHIEKLRRLADDVARITIIAAEAAAAPVGDHTHAIADITGLQAALDALVPASRQVTAGPGLTGGGSLVGDIALNVGAGAGITVNPDDVAIAINGVLNTMLADMAEATIKGRAAGAGTGDPQDLTAAQVAALIDHGLLLGLNDDDHGAVYPGFAQTESISGQWTWTVPLRLADGTEALPGLTFGSDTDTGLHRPSNNSIGFSLGGVRLVEMSASGSLLRIGQDTTAATVGFALNSAAGQLRDIAYRTAGVNRWIIRVDNSAESGGNVGSDLQFLARDDTGASLGSSLTITRATHFAAFGGQIGGPVGSAAAPTYTWTGDPDTGMFRDGSNTIGFSGAGTQMGRWAAAGFEIHSNTPRLRLFDTNAGLDAKWTEIDGNSGFALQFLDDTVANDVNVLTIARSGTTPGAWVLSGSSWQFNAGFTEFIAHPLAASNTLRVNARTDTATAILFSAPSGTRGMRFSFTDSTESRIEGVDQTGSVSHQPIGLGGSEIRLRTSGTLRALLQATSLDLTGDSYELRIGAGNDLRLYHNGTDSIIENDTGKLHIRGAGYNSALSAQALNTFPGAFDDGIGFSVFAATNATRFQTDPTTSAHVMAGFLDSSLLEISRGTTSGFVSGLLIAPRSTTSPEGEGVGIYVRNSRQALFSNALSRFFSSVVEIENTNPFLLFDETDAAADERRYAIEIQGGVFVLKTQNDAVSVARNLFSFDRSGAAVTTMDFGNATDNPAFNFLGTGVATFGGPLRGANGSPSAPEYSFTNATNAGVSWDAGNTGVSINVGGVSSWLATTAAVFTTVPRRGADGSNTAPAYSFTNDTNTGIYRPNSDQLFFAEGGVGYRIGFRQVPRSSTTSGTLTAAELGFCVPATGGITINNSVFAAGDALSIYNDSASAITITQGSGVTMRLAGTTTTGNRTLAARGMATLWFNSASEVIVGGAGVT